MPYKEHIPEKLYYTMGEVSEMFELNASAIRFWEKEFEILQPKRNKKGNRLFTQADIENLKLIYILTQEQGFTIEGAKQQLKNTEKKHKLDNIQQVVNKLEKLKNSLLLMTKGM